jgi:hypothetical protein
MNYAMMAAYADDATFAYIRAQSGLNQPEEKRVRINRDPFGRNMADLYHGRDRSSMQGLMHGWYGSMRKQITPFGSGYLGELVDRHVQSARNSIPNIKMKDVVTKTTQSNVSRLEREVSSLTTSRMAKNFFRFK